MWAAIPATVVEDSSSVAAVYVRPGTIFAGPTCTRDEHLRVAASGSWKLHTTQWVGQHHVWATIPGQPCSLWTMWSDRDWTHLGWKLNPEAPWRRTTLEFDTIDYALDAVISADLSSWEWKDEKEFAEAIELGLIAASDAAQIREATSALAGELLTHRRELLERWPAWRPPANWPTPALIGEWTTP